MAHDALAAHSRDELGVTGIERAQPLLAAAASAASFSLGAALPLDVVVLVSLPRIALAIVVSTPVGLVILGWLPGSAVHEQ